MKKKFINGILMVAMLFAATSSFVSCKDNVDDDISPIYAQLGKKSAELQAKIDSLKKEMDEKEYIINQYITNIDTTIINNFYDIDTTIINVIENLDSVKEAVTVINEQIINQNNQITNITLAIDSIDNVLNSYEIRINQMGDSVNTLWTRVDSIIGILDALVGGNLITGVNIETTRNDVLGIINTPAFKVNALAAYYGTNDSGIEEFPYAGYDFNVGGSKFAEYLEDYELPEAGYENFDESDYITDIYGNAGQIYFTVNSTDYDDFDISKITKIQIENSAGEVAPIQLNIRKSSARINWDFGRAFLEETGKDVNNGLYVADATITEDNLDPSRFQIEKFINFEKLKSEIKKRIDDIRTVEGESSYQNSYTTDKAKFKNFVREIASLAYGILKNDLTQSDLATNITYSPQRLAFFVEKDGKMKRVAQTPVDLLTTAVKPLSYNTFWEYEKGKKDNWIIETVLEKAVSRIAKEIKERWGDKGIHAKIVSINDSEESVTIQLNDKTETFKVSNAQYMSDLKKAINVNGGLDAVNDKLAKLLKTYTLGNAVTKVEGRINDYLTKASDQLSEWINKHLFTRAIAPIIIFETNTGMDRLCEGMIFNKGTMHAYLTSGTMELLVPAYKKYVALKKNGQLLQSEVLPGNTQSYDFDLNEKGDYTVILSCVDYFGFVITKKYNVHVK